MNKYGSNSIQCNNYGIYAMDGQNTAYIYLCGIKPVRDIKISSNITLMAVKSAPDPDDMINCVMKCGNQDEYTLGLLIATLRRVTAQLKITDSNARSLAINTWNAQTICVQLSAMLNCEISWYFEADKPADKFDAKTIVSPIHSHISMPPRRVVKVDEEKCKYIEDMISVAWKLGNDKRFSNATNALWNYNHSAMPAVQLSVIWGGIESLFLIERGIKQKIALCASRFLLNDDSMVEEIKKLYEGRCKAVHEYKNTTKNILENSILLLHLLIKRCIEVNSIPDVEELLKENNT